MAKSYKVSGIKVTFGKIKVDEVEKNKFKKGQYQAQIRQKVSRTYPAGKIGNSKADLLFDDDAKDVKDGETFTSTRVTWLPLTKKRTVEQVEKQLKKYSDANIWRIISDDVEDVLTEEQIAATESDRYDDIDMDYYSEKLLVRGKDGEELDDDLYSQNFFSKEGKKDNDCRDSVESSVDFEEVEEDVEDVIED